MHAARSKDTAFFIDEALRSWSSRSRKVDVAAWDKAHSRETYDRRFAAGPHHAAVGEKCADIIFWQPAHARVARILPEARFIVVLRDPVSRAWSHYWNEVGKGREPLDFESSLEAEEQRARESDVAAFHLSYKKRGFYADSLDAFFEHVDRERVLTLIMERAYRDPARTADRIFEFLGVDSGPEHRKHVGAVHNENQTMLSRDWVSRFGLDSLEDRYCRWSGRLARFPARLSRDPVGASKRIKRYLQLPFRYPADRRRMAPRTEAHLRELYRPHIRRVEKLLETRIDEWK